MKQILRWSWRESTLTRKLKTPQFRAAGLANPLTIVDYCRTYRVKSSINHTQYHFQLHTRVRDCDSLCNALISEHICVWSVLLQRDCAVLQADLRPALHYGAFRKKNVELHNINYCSFVLQKWLIDSSEVLIQHIFRRSVCDWNRSSESSIFCSFTHWALVLLWTAVEEHVELAGDLCAEEEAAQPAELQNMCLTSFLLSLAEPSFSVKCC